MCFVTIPFMYAELELPCLISYIGELLYVSSEELEHIRTIPLYVITVYSNQKSSINTENSKSALFSNYQYNHSQHNYQ